MRVNQEKLQAVAERLATQLTRPGPLELPVMVGLKEIGAMFGAKENTPYQWRSKGVLPASDDDVSNNPQWKLITIYEFAKTTNRKIVWDPWGVLEEDDERG